MFKLSIGSVHTFLPFKDFRRFYPSSLNNYCEIKKALKELKEKVVTLENKMENNCCSDNLKGRVDNLCNTVSKYSVR